MTIHATARVEYVISRIMAYLEALALTGSPKLTAARVPGQSGSTGPWVRATFDELPALHKGRFSSTQSAIERSLLLSLDIFWPEMQQTIPASLDVLGDVAVASELADALQFLRLSFLDYSVPATPVEVADAMISCSRPPEVTRIPDTDGFIRRRVKASIVWYARYDDNFA